MRKEGKRKALAALVCGSMLTVALVGGTLAYLQDTDSDVNVMTLGNVSIEQHEYERAVDADGAYETKEIDGVESYVLKDFTQGKPLLPIVGDPNEPGDSPAYAGWDGITVRMTQVDSYGGMDVFAGKNAQDKFVTVENTGRTDAYVRTLVAIEIGSTDGTLIRTSARAAQATDATSTAPWIESSVGNIEIDGNNYRVVEYVYRGASDVDRHVNGVLPAGDTSYPSLCQVYLKHNATNEDMEDIDGDGNGTLDILVLSQAVQVDGFDNAQTALDTAFGAANAKNAAAWFAGTSIPTLVGTANELIEALEAGEDVALTEDIKIDPASMSNAYGTTGINVRNGQTIDGDGHTLDIQGAGGTWDSGICTSGGLIKDITVTGSFRGIFIKKDSVNNEPVVLENVTIKDTTYTISVDSGTGKGLIATDSTFKGWTSYAGTLGNAEFVDCYFGEGSGYSFCRPYAPTTFVGCDFEAGYVMDARAAVTFENCTIGGQPLTADNLATLVAYNTQNATVL